MSAPTLGMAHQPKMVSEPVTQGKKLGPSSPEIRVKSNFTAYMGDCSPDSPFELTLYGPSGRGAIGVHGPVDRESFEILFSDSATAGTVDITGPAEANFFALEYEDVENYESLPFQYRLNAEPSADGIPVKIKCTYNTPILVLVDDDVDFEIEAVVTEFFDGDEIEIVGDVGSEAPLKGCTRTKKGPGNSPVTFEPSTGKKIKVMHGNSPLTFEPSTGKKIKVMHQPGNSGKGIALVDGVFTTSSGTSVRRTLIRESKLKPADFKKPRSISIKCCEVNDDGGESL